MRPTFEAIFCAAKPYGRFPCILTFFRKRTHTWQRNKTIMNENNNNNIKHGNRAICPLRSKSKLLFTLRLRYMCPLLHNFRHIRYVARLLRTLANALVFVLSFVKFLTSNECQVFNVVIYQIIVLY